MRPGGSVKNCTLRKSNMAPTQPTQPSPAGTGAERLRLPKRCKQGQARPVPRPLCPAAVGWPPRGSPPGSCWAPFWFLDRLARGYGPVVQLHGPLPLLLCGIMVSGPGWLLWRDKRTAAGGSQSPSGAWCGGRRIVNSEQRGGLNRPLPLGVHYPRDLLAVL